MISINSLGELSVEEFMALSSSADEEEDEFLRERNSRKRKIMSSKKKGKELQRLDVDSEEEVGVVEPRPFEVTSWKKASRVSIFAEEEASLRLSLLPTRNKQRLQCIVTTSSLHSWTHPQPISLSMHSPLYLGSSAPWASSITTFHHKT